MRSGGKKKKKKKKRSQFIQIWLYLHRAASASQGGRFHLSEMNHLISLKFATGGSSRDEAGLDVSFCSSYFTATPPHPSPARNRCHDKRSGELALCMLQSSFPSCKEGECSVLCHVGSRWSDKISFHRVFSPRWTHLRCCKLWLETLLALSAGGVFWKSNPSGVTPRD